MSQVHNFKSSLYILVRLHVAVVCMLKIAKQQHAFILPDFLGGRP